MKARHPAAAYWLEAAWLRNLSALGLMAAVAFMASLYGYALRTGRQPFALDFMSFWAASRLALTGHALDAYSLPPLAQAARLVYPTYHPPGAWFYPPTFFLLVLPSALVSFGLASVVFGVASVAVLLAAFRKMLPYRYVGLLVLTFPGVWFNFVQGQNGSLTAGLAAFALFFLPRRPVLAGFFIGLLAIKPHLAVLFPLCLICARQWRAFAMAAASATVFALLPLLYFNGAVYPVFLHSVAVAQHMVAAGELPLAQMVGVFPSLRLRQVPVPTAYAVHLAIAAAAVLATAYVWCVSRQPWMRASVLVAATFLCSPYLYNYDAVWLVLPLAFFNLQARSTGWLAGERAVLTLAWIYPPVGTELTAHLNFSCGPFLCAALLGLGLRRVWRERRGVTPLVLG